MTTFLTLAPLVLLIYGAAHAYNAWLQHLQRRSYDVKGPITIKDWRKGVTKR